MLKPCSYCKKMFTKLTGEHVVSRSILTKFYENGRGYSHYSESQTSNYLKIHDVCSDCNNSILSKLDDKFLKFYSDFDVLQAQKISLGTEINIQYEYDFLSKWLLKTLYNSERKQGYNNLPKKMERYREHIIGKRDQSKIFRIYVELLGDVNLSDAEKSCPELIKDGLVKMPFLKMGNAAYGAVCGKEVCINSEKAIKYFISQNIVFYIFLLDPKRNKPNHIKEYEDLFSDESGNIFIKPLDSNKNSVILKSSGRTVIDLIAVSMNGNMTSLEQFLSRNRPVKKDYLPH